jgi:protocatechuate 3,4-dioxygenase beta subunit
VAERRVAEPVLPRRRFVALAGAALVAPLVACGDDDGDDAAADGASGSGASTTTGGPTTASPAPTSTTTAAPPASVDTAPPTAAPADAGSVAPDSGLPEELPCTGEFAATSRMSEGEHYRSGAPEKVALVEPGMVGTRLLLTGYVLLPDCRPADGAVLDVWQADADGVYDDAGTRLRGVFRADAHGRYAIDTIMPGVHDDRPPHVHMKLAEGPNGRIVTVCMFFAGDPRNESDRAYRPEVAATLTQRDDGVLVARFDAAVEIG